MIRYWKPCLLALSLYGAGAAAQDGRGELLYQTYCQNCHDQQVHWRDKAVAQDWTGLVAEVKRWQANGNLDWNGDDIEQVARYLNRRFYRHPVPAR